jgi:tRNA splicing ligase
MEYEKLMNAVKGSNLYEYVAQNYQNMTSENLKDLLLEVEHSRLEHRRILQQHNCSVVCKFDEEIEQEIANRFDYLA